MSLETKYDSINLIKNIKKFNNYLSVEYNQAIKFTTPDTGNWHQLVVNFFSIPLNVDNFLLKRISYNFYEVYLGAVGGYSTYIQIDKFNRTCYPTVYVNSKIWLGISSNPYEVTTPVTGADETTTYLNNKENYSTYLATFMSMNENVILVSPSRNDFIKDYNLPVIAKNKYLNGLVLTNTYPDSARMFSYLTPANTSFTGIANLTLSHVVDMLLIEGEVQ